MRDRTSIVVVAWSLTSCVAVPKPPTVVYLDRNRDGRVDFEMHHPNGKGFDALEWAYSDDDYDGYYDRKREFGELMSIVERVHIPVPKAQFRDTPHQPTPSPSPRKRPNQTMQRTASKPATDVLSVCHPPADCESRFTGLAVADLGSR